MITPTGSSLFPGTSGATFGLDAQLDRYRKQLADCVNCSSAKTPEGKAKIEELSNRIGEIKSRIEKVADAKQPAPPDGVVPTALPNPLAVVGSRLDVYA